MKQQLYIFTWLSLLCTMVVSCSTSKKTLQREVLTTRDSTQIVQAIQSVLDSQTMCWNKGDLTCFTSFYADKPYSCIMGGDGPICGWEDINAIYHAAYPPEKMGNLNFTDINIYPLSHRIAIVRGKYNLDQEEVFFQSGWYTLVFEKLKTGWRIISDQTG